MALLVMAALLGVRALCPIGVVGAVSAGGASGAMEGFSYSVEGAKTWEPMAGSRPVTLTRVSGRDAFEMPCNFRGTNIERASWDHPIEQDLSMCQGLGFLFYCPDPSPVGSFTVYLHSENGWYRGNFDAPAAKQWVPVRIAKSAMHVEGNPGGWSKVDTIRISAWRGGDEDTRFCLCDFSAYGADVEIVVLRGDSAAGRAPNELNAVRQYSDVMCGLLERASLSHLVLSDLDATAAKLKDTKVVILPHNPAMPDGVSGELVRFIEAGGKLLVCYHLPKAMETAVGIQSGRHVRQPHSGYFASIRPGDQPVGGMPSVTRQASWNINEGSATGPDARVAAWWYTQDDQPTGRPAVVVSDNCVYLTHVLLRDDPENKHPLLLSMLGHLMPQIWSRAAQGCIDRIGRFGSYDDYDAARRAIAQLDNEAKRADEALGRADTLRKESLSLLAEGKFSEAMEAAQSASDAMVEAYCLAQRPLPGEHRAFWCHSAFGVEGMTWDEAIKLLAHNGFTAILPNMLWGGVAYYPSDVLPTYNDLKAKGDQIGLCLAACKKYGVQCHVWKVNFNMGWATDEQFMDRMRSLGRVQVSYDGSANERWLCPSHPDNQTLEVESMLEVARKYDVDGLHFDYIRYPGMEACFCEGCRRRFEQKIGAKVERWPADVRENNMLEKEWLDFRREQITSVVAQVAERARRIRPGIKISAAVFRNWPTDRDSIGQDWGLWCEKGYLDFVCPMDYVSSNATFERMVKQQRGWAGKVPCYPGIGLSVWDEPDEVVRLIEQITITRRLGTGGFTVFNYGPREARDVLALLGKGLTRADN